jgi:hypothetical protein
VESNGPNTRAGRERRTERRLSDDDFEALRERISKDVTEELKTFFEKFALRALVVILGASGGTSTLWHFVEKIIAEGAK